MMKDRCQFHAQPGDHLVSNRDCEAPAHHEDWDAEMLSKTINTLEAIVMYPDVKNYIAAQFPGLIAQIEKTLKELGA